LSMQTRKLPAKNHRHSFSAYFMQTPQTFESFDLSRSPDALTPLFKPKPIGLTDHRTAASSNHTANFIRCITRPKGFESVGFPFSPLAPVHSFSIHVPSLPRPPGTWVAPANRLTTRLQRTHSLSILTGRGPRIEHGILCGFPQSGRRNRGSVSPKVQRPDRQPPVKFRK